mmetsp:Transcript_164222/g.526668  ORF Transcript_164222/g.526668 Transcript_164222/m.526668 type:complete len:341 (+) Transcript_164222:138-1160(+)
MMGPGSTWFMDAAALGGWTARGTARVLQDRFAALPADQRQAWMESLSPQRMEELLTKVIVDVVEAAQLVQDYMDSERAKGRDFEEIYLEVKPYIERVSRPISEDMRDGTYDPTSTEEAPFMAAAGGADPEAQIHAEAVAREHARQTAPHQNLAAWFDIGSPGAGNRSQGSAAAADPAAPSTGQPAAPPPDLLREEDLDEPLMAIGSCNGWRVDEARRLHCFEPCLDSPPELRVKVLRMLVPAKGVQFQILSREKGWEWLLFPSRKQGTLHRGEARSVAAALVLGPHADEKSTCRDFRVKGDKGPIIEIRVSLTMERGARVWMTEVHDDEPLLSITFPSME